MQKFLKTMFSITVFAGIVLIAAGAASLIRTIVVSSMNEQASQYSTSRSDINRLWLNSVWSTRSNFMSVPTDCPQRNERLGWMGDISVFGRSATYITDASQFLRRYLISVRDLQSYASLYPLSQTPQDTPTCRRTSPRPSCSQSILSSRHSPDDQ